MMSLMALLLLLWLALPSVSSAQGCCSSGSSNLGSLYDGVLREDSVRVELGYRHESLSRTQRGSEVVADDLERDRDRDLLHVDVAYGIARTLTLIGSVGLIRQYHTAMITDAGT